METMSSIKKDKGEESPPKQNQRSRSKDDAKRANHNALERKRRIFQKERLLELKDCVPTIKKDEKSSTVEILQKATEYIEDMVMQISQKEREIEQIGNAKGLSSRPSGASSETTLMTSAVIKRSRSDIEDDVGVVSPDSNDTSKRARHEAPAGGGASSTDVTTVT